MNVPHIELHQARTLAEASALMERHAPSARLLAGGTDLLVDLKSGRVVADHVVSINRIAGLRGLSMDDAGLRIAALTTPNQLARASVVRARFPALLDATRDMAASQVRNMATVGGNVASAIPSADLPPILLVMNASVALWSAAGTRDIPLSDFFLGPRRSARRPDEILTALVIPLPPPGFGAAYARFALREANACAVAGVAASLKLSSDQTIEEAKVALAAVAPVPTLVEGAAALLAGQAPAEDAFARVAEEAARATEPISDIRGSADYRREIVGVLTRRALNTALSRATES